MRIASHSRSFRSILRHVLYAIALSALLPQQASADEKFALVIGNAKYEHAKALANPTNDADDVSRALSAGGWTVTAVKDAGVRDMLRSLREFCETAEGADAALVFYAGHAIEVKGKNYLLPVDAALDESDGEDALPLETLSLDKVLADLRGARIRLKTVVLDSCRDDPLTRSWLSSRSSGGGMATVEEKQLPEGTMLVFSTAPGRTAADGRGRNSPFTSALLQRMQSGGGGLAEVFGDVAVALGETQAAWIRFDGSGVSFTAFRRYPLLPGGSPARPAPPAPVDHFAGVTRNAPFENELGMKFVPAGTPGVLFSMWETRVRDFVAFVADTGYDAISEANGDLAFTLEDGGKWKQAGGTWKDPRFPKSAGQTGEHPVVCVSYQDAEEFCVWLTKRDRAAGKIPAAASYRLPTSEEWSKANGSGKYPWGDSYPPKSKDGNYLGKEGMVGALQGLTVDLVNAGFSDSAARTSVVGMFAENNYGLHDMGGNVAEWCATWYRASLNEAGALEQYQALKNDGGGETYRVLRGGSWNFYAADNMRSSLHTSGAPRSRVDRNGFRCVLEISGG